MYMERKENKFLWIGLGVIMTISILFAGFIFGVFVTKKQLSISTPFTDTAQTTTITNKQPCTNEKIYSDLNEALVAAKKVCVLDLSGQQLSQVPRRVGELTNLEVLYLYNNQLTDLPLEIFELTALKVLSLIDNQFTKLPQEIKNLKNLNLLILSGNNFSREEQTKLNLLLPNTNITF